MFIVNVQLNKNYVFSVPRTCSEYKDRGFSQSGQFMIDPDQQKGGSTKFIVYCDFENGNQFQINTNAILIASLIDFPDLTKVFHDLINETIITLQCREAHCFNQPLVYEVSMSEISQLISVSEECYQDVWFSCYSTKLTKHAAWKDRYGDIQQYFTTNFTNVCDCYQNDSCFSVSETNYCNCDAGDIVQREDLVRITNKVSDAFTFTIFAIEYSFITTINQGSTANYIVSVWIDVSCSSERHCENWSTYL